ncbi:hypothetical protein HNV08_15720 [Winogradskyella eckloniae]|uniref:hypothetical protein n=1 Tax=Winogradskyella eckloniae TaxID=1089306 RepID=UPI001567BA38|nr:hypothetical protein [Winogradskyella eckloniae]NRD21503.1 hypothetical protein [Winogradskyella eckloniae]
MNQNTIDEGKTLGLVAYLTLLGTLIAFFMNQDKKNPFTAFHIRQGLGLGILYMIIAFGVSSMDSMMVSMSFWLFFSILYFYGLIGAISGKMNKIPFIGDVFQTIFKSIGQ